MHPFLSLKYNRYTGQSTILHLGEIVEYPYDPFTVSCMDLFVEISCVDRFDEKNMSAELEAEPLSE